MPLERISSREAFARLKSANGAYWPNGFRPTRRMNDPVHVVMKPSFRFSTQDRIMTIGSCFARNIEKKLVELGFDLPMMKVEVPREERVSETANDILNKYTVHSMENEIRWAFEGNPCPYEDLFVQVDDGLWHDPHLAPNLKPAPFERVRSRREDVSAAYRELASCRVIVITLGLAEAWFDQKIGIYLNGTPPDAAIKREPERFAFDVLSYEDIFDSLQRVHALVKKHGNPEARILITVSPVPFKASFSGNDAISGNTYSKSVQRAACEAFVRAHDDIDYFPSYEIVTLTGRNAFTPDNIHVKPAVVNTIMARVLDIYTTNKEYEFVDKGLPQFRADIGLKAILEKARSAFSAKDYGLAAEFYAFAIHNFEDRFNDSDKRTIYADYGVTLLRLGRADAPNFAEKTNAGVEMLFKALPYDLNGARLHYKIGLGLARLRKNAEALQWFKRALELDDSVPDHYWRYGVQLQRLGRMEEAFEAVKAATKIKPDHAEALAFLRELADPVTA